MFRYKYLSILFYKQPMGIGIGESDKMPEGWRYPAPGSVGEFMLDYVCDYVD